MQNIDKIKIVISGASGKPYKFEAKIREKSKATNLFRQFKKSLTRKYRSAIYFSFTISDCDEAMIKYDIISYGYVNDIDLFLKKFWRKNINAQSVFIAYHIANKANCPSILCDLIKSPGFDAVKEHTSKIYDEYSNEEDTK